MKGKALRRALASGDALRVNTTVPLITDTTELITPDLARTMLAKNHNNRPINWRKVEEFAAIMASGGWELTAQGIVLDGQENILTGQKRLWAVVYSGANVYMRVSRGNASHVAKLLDRGDPQTSRDLASRDTGRKHSPTEASIARAYSVLMGNTRPTVDVIAQVISAESDNLSVILKETARTKKNKAMLMILGAICVECHGDEARQLAMRVVELSERLEVSLLPHTAAECWNRGAAFGLAMNHARQIVCESKAIR